MTLTSFVDFKTPRRFCLSLRRNDPSSLYKDLSDNLLKIHFYAVYFKNFISYDLKKSFITIKTPADEAVVRVAMFEHYHSTMLEYRSMRKTYEDMIAVAAEMRSRIALLVRRLPEVGDQPGGFDALLANADNALTLTVKETQELTSIIDQIFDEMKKFMQGTAAFPERCVKK
jgi:hypothetical protein